MYAERTAKGNVLEPEGMIEIKFRTKELLECMGRLDQHLINLKESLQAARGSGDPGVVEALKVQIRSREKQLLPVYTQIATRFAELHDTSLRMASKGVIKEVVDWENSRSFFYKRLNRRVAEGSLVKVDDPRNYEEQLQELRVEKILLQLSSIGESTSDLQALPQGLAGLLSKVEPSSRVQLVEELRKVLS
ncbi:hypothetical protein AQUCO_01300375v1 [Aquilegia coerulea]|uniref:CoA carboxyltransferase C-terminal domain-containing protein n=1 Tax=Aquilegia coerulea TaxID=218851 RepID=A0A2G5E184_AQUCA|nr:hypothetical protein AQUCO_01300375v1 [Aquilegia coerulea]